MASAFASPPTVPPTDSHRLPRCRSSGSSKEALTNVRKHAAASEASVTLTSCPPGELTVVIADDGRGFGGARNGGGRRQPLGLTSMPERVEGLGGRLEVSSQPGAGTRVTATIPTGHAKEDWRAAVATPAGR